MYLETLNRVIENLTAKEIDFIIYAMRFQDDLGVIKGITRDEVCAALGIHKSKFYNILQSLEKKQIISVLWDEKRHGFWTISVIGNSFVSKSDYKKGYINLNTKFLYSSEFLEFKKAEKIICLKLLSLYREHKDCIALKLDTLSRWTGASIQSVKKYVESLKSLFSVSVSKNVVFVDLKKCFNLFSRSAQTENEIHDKHLLNYILMAKKADAGECEIQDTLALFSIFRGKYGINAIVTGVLECVESYGRLVPRYVNKMIRLAGARKIPIELFY